MKKTMKRLTGIILVLVMFITTAPLSGLMPKASAYSVGDIIEFGNYPQLNVSEYLRARLAEQEHDAYGRIYYDGKIYYRNSSSNYYEMPPIKWRVLSVDSDGIFIISDKILTASKYHNAVADITWSKCSLRTWLNNSFYNLAFTDSEKIRINTTHLQNGDNPWCGTDGGIDTDDKVFIPSAADVLNPDYGFPSNDSRIASNTPYTSATDYWLRNPGRYPTRVCVVKNNGTITYDSTWASDSRGIRPAIKLSFGSVVYNSKVNSQYEIKVVDSDTRSPIENAKVTYNNVVKTVSKSGTAIISTTANSQSTDSVTISANGYPTTVVKIYDLNPYGTNIFALEPGNSPASLALADLYLNGASINGPTVSIMNKTFPLFKFDAKLNIPLSKIRKLNVSTANDTKNKTVKYILGVKDGYTLNSDSKRNEDYKNFKAFYKLVTDGSNASALSKYNSLRRNLKTENGSLGFDCGLKFAGYLEFSYATGKMVLKEGGITVTAEANVSTDVPFWGICYATFKIGGEFESGFSIKQTANGTLGATGKLGISVKPSIGAGVKLLSKDIASVEAGINGKINGSVKIPAETFSKAFSAYLNANAYIKVKALKLFEHKWSTNYPNLELYPNFGKFQQDSFDGGEITIDGDGNIINIGEDDLELISRDYLGKFTLDSFSPDSVISDGLNDESVYPYGYPQLVQLDDGSIVAVFLYDDGTKSDINRATLYYSVYSNNEWSISVPVCDSGFADFPAEVCTDGEKVYAVWQRASEILNDNYIADDVVDKTELVYAEFNGSEWSEPVTVDTAGKYQMMYSIAENNGKVAVEWAENSANSYTLSTGVTSVYYKTLESGIWSSDVTAASSTGIACAAIGFNGNNVSVIYSVDADGDLTTPDDSELYANGTKITDNSVDEGEITYQNGKFYWIQGTELCEYNGSTVNNTGLNIEADYRVLSNGSTTAVTFLKSDGFTNELAVSYLNNGSYTNPVEITEYKKHISFYDAVLNSDGNISLLADVENLSGSDDYPYTTTDMVCDIINGRTNLGISDTVCVGTATHGGEVNFTGIITNNGTKKVDSYTINFKDSSGEIIRTLDISDEIISGEKAEFSASYIIPDDFVKGDITADVVVDNDYDISDNSQKFTVGYADIEIVNAAISREGEITATIVNNGLEEASNVKIAFANISGEENTTIETVTIGSLDISETKTIEYTVPNSYLSFDNCYVVNRFKLEVSTDTEEFSIGNNDFDVIYTPVVVESIALNTSTLMLECGSSSQLIATVYPSDALNQKVHWVSDSTDIVTVDDSGNVTAIGAGKAIITAITDEGDFVAQCEVTVIINVTSVELDQSNITLNVGSSVTLFANVKPAEASDTSVTWTSSDVSVATVDENGVVKGLKSGIATITAKTNNGGYEASCTINVKNAVTGITISDVSLRMYTGKTKQLSANVTPYDADNQKVIWSSDDEDIAEVDENGIVTAIAPGTAIITATTDDGNFKATCAISIGKHVSSIYISESTLSLNIGFTEQLTAIVLPISALNKTVYWLSTNTKVATVDENGIVTAVSAGNATIIAYAEDGEYTSTCNVTVTNSVGSFELSEDEFYIARNETYQLTGIFNPDTAENKDIIWKSTNPEIASVDTNGLVIAKMAGTAMIVATTIDGGYKDYCSVKVVGIEALSTANIDLNSGIITGLVPNLKSLDKYVEVTDNTCELQYDSVGTDTIVYLTRNDTIIDAYTVVIFGDVNGDGVYDGTDSIIVNCLANGLLAKEQVGEAVYMAADCNHDDVIDEADVALLEQAGLILASVDQNKTVTELFEDAAFCEYINLINQSPVTTEKTVEEVLADTTPVDKPVINKTLLKKIIDFIIYIFKMITVYIPKVF